MAHRAKHIDCKIHSIPQEKLENNNQKKNERK